MISQNLYAVSIAIDRSKKGQFLKEYVDVEEALFRGDTPAGLRKIATYLEWETNSKMYVIWEAKSREALENFYKGLSYLRVTDISPVGLVAGDTIRSEPTGPKVAPRPPLSAELIDALNRIRDDLELILLELAKGVAKQS
jgi:hypothetical protein